MIGEMKLTNTAFVQEGIAGAAATRITTVNTVVLVNLKIQEKIKLYGVDTGKLCEEVYQ